MGYIPDGCWFNLPDGQTATELEVTVPVKGRVKMPASAAKEMDDWRDLLLESMVKQKWTVHGSLHSMLASCIAGYERIAADALAGAESVRDDMLCYLRSVVLVIESITGDHLSHGQKNERLRGVLGVLERNIASLREEKFSFHEQAWRRGKDLFAWNERERRLREKIELLQTELNEMKQATKPPSIDEL